MDYLLIGVYLAILVHLWVTVSLFKQLTDHINDLMTELVEDLPPALGEAMGESLPQIQGMGEINPIQMAIAQIIPRMFENRPIEAKVMKKDEKGQFINN